MYSESGQGDPHGEHVAGVEAGIDLGKLVETANQLCRSRHQRDGAGHLRHYQRLARPRALAAARRVAAFAQRVLQVARPFVQRSGQSEGYRAGQRHPDREQHQPGIHGDFSHARQCRTVKVQQETHASPSDAGAGHAADSRQHQALRKVLANLPEAGGAQRRAQREFAAAPSVARQQEARDIRASHQRCTG